MRFECKFCNKKFKRLQSLRTHLKLRKECFNKFTLDGDWVPKVEVSDTYFCVFCGKEFESLNSMGLHKRYNADCRAAHKKQLKLDADTAYAQQGYKICKICGGKFKSISNTDRKSVV